MASAALAALAGLGEAMLGDEKPRWGAFGDLPAGETPWGATASGAAAGAGGVGSIAAAAPEPELPSASEAEEAEEAAAAAEEEAAAAALAVDSLLAEPDAPAPAAGGTGGAGATESLRFRLAVPEEAQALRTMVRCPAGCKHCAARVCRQTVMACCWPWNR